MITETRPGSSESTKSEKEPLSKSPDLGPLSEFHQLLLLRMLRPDRLPVALAKYINKYLTLNLPGMYTGQCQSSNVPVLRPLDYKIS